jgi:response regulator of citrate/malate metabolism
MFTVLHVEYSNFCKRIVKDLLIHSYNDLKYVSAQTPSESKQILEDEKVNLIITGLEFINETGEEFIKSVSKSKYKDIPIIVLSANEDEEMKRKLFAEGAAAYINKDAHIERLKNYVSKYRNRKVTKENEEVNNFFE